MVISGLLGSERNESWLDQVLWGQRGMNQVVIGRDIEKCKLK